MTDDLDARIASARARIVAWRETIQSERDAREAAERRRQFWRDYDAKQSVGGRLLRFQERAER